MGGLIGWNEGTVGASFATGDVTGAGSAGGLIGRSARTIIATYATGNVTGSGDPDCGTGLTCPSIGGLIGDANKGDPVVTPSNVQASYSTGSVSGRLDSHPRQPCGQRGARYHDAERQRQLHEQLLGHRHFRADARRGLRR